MITFDSSPVSYWAGGIFLLLSTALITATSVFENQYFNKNWLVRAAIFLQLLLLVYFRLPAIFFNEALNPDENLFIVGAMTLAESPLYWESVDGCTSGPFNFYIITAFCETFEQPYDYISARIVGILLMVGSFLCSFLTIRRLFSASVALMSVFPAITFMGLTTHWDFVNFSSEQLPIFLISLMLYFFTKIYLSKASIYTWDTFILGLISGSVIFTKLQAIPIAFGLTIFTYWLIFQKSKDSFLKNAFYLTIGGCTTLIVLVFIGYNYNFLDKIWVFYIKNNLAYGKTSSSLISHVVQSLNDPINIFIKILIVLSTVAVGYFVGYKRQLKVSILGGLMAIFILCTIFSIYKTGFMFHHYLLFMITPSVFLFAFLLNEIEKSRKRIISIGVTLLATLWLATKTSATPFTNYFISSDKPQRPLSISKTGHQILKYTHPDESLVVWGDAGRLYLETKRTQGVRWSNSHWGMYSDSLQKTFQKEFIMELKEKPFPVFVDAHPTQNTFMTRDKIGYETNRELKEHIDSNYQFIGEFDEQRVFVHKQRLEEVNASK